MGFPLKNDRLDAQAYLDWEAQQPGRSEYIDGEVFAMVGYDACTPLGRAMCLPRCGNICAAHPVWRSPLT